MSTTTTGPHLTDSEIVRLADGEGGAGAWQRHVDGCEPCAAAVRSFRDDAEVVSDWLARADIEATLPSDIAPLTHLTRHGSSPRPASAPVHRWAPWLKVAAAIVIVTGPLAAFPSVREWVGTRIGAPGPAPDVAVESPESAPAPSVVRFIPDAGTFTVQFPAAGPRATLTLVRTPGLEARLRTDDPTLETTVSSSVLRVSPAGAPGDTANGIGTADAEAADITLELPAAVEVVEVRIGERVVRVEGAELDRGRTLDLTAASTDS